MQFLGMITPEEFKAARKARKMTQLELAKWLNVSYSAVTKWETGKNPVPQWVAEKLQDQKGVFVLDDYFSLDEAAKIHELAKARGMSADGLIAEMVKHLLKFSG